MNVTVSSIEFEVDYEYEHLYDTLKINEILHNGEDFTDMLSHQVCQKIVDEILLVERDANAGVNHKEEAWAEALQEERALDDH